MQEGDDYSDMSSSSDSSDSSCSNDIEYNVQDLNHLPPEIRAQINSAMGQLPGIFQNLNFGQFQEEYDEGEDVDPDYYDEYELNPDYQGEEEKVTTHQRKQIINSIQES